MTATATLTPGERRPVTPDRLRAAAHEAGHGVMAVLLGQRCQGLKLNGDRSGVAFSRCPDHNENDRVGGSLLLLDRSLRDRVESDIVIWLAGPLAADNWAPPTTNYTPDASRVELERITRELEDDPVFRERVADWDATLPLERRSDVDSVSEAAFLWCGSGSAAARFAGWLYSETEALVDHATSSDRSPLSPARCLLTAPFPAPKSSGS
jgi:hypothetical protein